MEQSAKDLRSHVIPTASWAPFDGLQMRNWYLQSVGVSCRHKQNVFLLWQLSRLLCLNTEPAKDQKSRGIIEIDIDIPLAMFNIQSPLISLAKGAPLNFQHMGTLKPPLHGLEIRFGPIFSQLDRTHRTVTPSPNAAKACA